MNASLLLIRSEYRSNVAEYRDHGLVAHATIMIITAHAYARAGVVGNPSDGYFGKTIACIVRNFRATVTLWESPQFEVVPAAGDLGRFDSVEAFLRDITLHGYYGVLRLINATIKRFTNFCRDNDVALQHRNFTISFTS